MKNSINIAYTLDNDNIYMILVSMQSIIENNINNIITFYLIIDEYFETDQYKIFSSLQQNENFNIKLIKESSNKFNRIKSKINFNKHIYCFDLYNLINETRVLYLDENTIINTDLSELYNTDLTKHSCAAPEYLYRKPLRKEFNINKDIFFNNSILLIDLDKWKKEKVFDKLLSINFDNIPNYPEMNQIVTFNFLINEK